jgi:carboxyl-terminal processing protease
MSEQRSGNWKKPSTTLSVILVLALIFLLASRCLSIFSPSEEIPADAAANFGLMAEAWNTIQKVYVDRSALKPKTMTYGAIRGLVDSLGDTGHSTFLTPEMIKEERESMGGSYKGVGIELRMDKGHALIVSPLDGSPAQKAGLRSGEIITMVNGRNLIGLNILQIVKLISGPVGTRVTLTVFDPESGKSHEVTLKRAPIEIDNVRWKPLPGDGIVQLRIAAFNKGVTKDLRKALTGLSAHGVKGIILDLRNNPGGLLDEAIGSTSQFLGKGNVLLEKSSDGKITSVPVKPGGVATRIPLVVLVNGGTASAAEIMAGAIQDAGRAKLLGRKTFGTGTVLRQFKLSDGSALMLAVREWLTPKGHSIWHKGISPDIMVKLPEGKRPLLPEQEKDLTLSKLDSSGDTQLLSALKLLTGERKAR